MPGSHDCVSVNVSTYNTQKLRQTVTLYGTYEEFLECLQKGTKKRPPYWYRATFSNTCASCSKVTTNLFSGIETK